MMTRPVDGALRPDSVLCRVGPPDVEHVEIDGETVVYDCRTKALHLLDPLATTIWEALDGTCTLRDLSEELAQAFAHPLRETTSDVLGFASDLCRLSLARIVAAPDE
jgi:hypothetical protein